MSILDGWLNITKSGKIAAIHWDNLALKSLYHLKWQNYINQHLTSIPEISFDPVNQHLIWNNDVFAYKELKNNDGFSIIVIKKLDHKEQLFKFALDEIKDGIQIYDNEARLVYLNQTSRKISGIPGHLEVMGKHLVELYDLDPEISTVMTTLRTRRPVINRFDNFKSSGGQTIVSVNTAYPIFDNHTLLGAVAFEQNLDSIRDQIEQLEERRDTIKKKVSLPVRKFSGYKLSDLIGHNHDLKVAISLAKKVARQNCNILLVGETGTGKEIFAQGIHKSSDRQAKKFVAVNCAAVPDTLIENVFFGTSKGSFTGSVERPGLLEEASGGILFLDELNSMSLSMQSKLLRVIQEGSFRRLGGGREIVADIRFISSCNEDPQSLIDNNILRKDLFYRLSTVTIDIPPLRSRKDDLEELINFYLSKHIDGFLKTVDGLSPETLDIFQHYHWPGNVRELFNVLDYVLNTVEDSRIEVKHLPRHLASLAEVGAASPCPRTGLKVLGEKFLADKTVAMGYLQDTSTAMGCLQSAPRDDSALEGSNCAPCGCPFTASNESGPILSPDQPGHFFPKNLEKLPSGDLNELLRTIEKKAIEDALLKSRYNLTRTALSLKLSRQNLQYRIKKLGIEL